MAEVELTVQTAQPKLGGRALTWTTLDFATNTYKFQNWNGMTRIILRGHASATDGRVTVAAQKKCSAGQDHDDTTAAAGLNADTKFIEMGPFDPNYFQDTDGFGWIEKYAATTTTGISIALVKG